VEEIRPMNVLIDINVPLDVFLAREPWLTDARAVWDAHDRRAIVGHIAAHGLTNLFYIAAGSSVSRRHSRPLASACKRSKSSRSDAPSWNWPTRSRVMTSKTTSSSPAPWSRDSMPSSPATPGASSVRPSRSYPPPNCWHNSQGNGIDTNFPRKTRRVSREGPGEARRIETRWRS
jgi:hypothetical protein